MRRACSKNLRPASVMLTKRVVRLKSCTPTRCSSAATVRVTAGGDDRKRTAAFAKPPVSATEIKTFSSLKRSNL